MEKKIIIFIALLISSLSFVIAVGSSSGGSNQIVTPSAITPQAAVQTRTTCESSDLAAVKDRIKCRFENKQAAANEAASVVEESCRGHAKTEECKQLYQKSRTCYDFANPVAKKRCFLEKSGVSINQGGTFRAAPSEVKKNYVILLLYNLQESIEKMQEQGTLTTEQAADLVTKIIEIKKDILNGKSRAEIVPKIQQFKQAYQTAVGGL